MSYKLADMTLFSRIDEGQVIISERGLHRQVDLYERGGQLYAARKDGFVRLLSGNLTTYPSTRWLTIEGIQIEESYNGPKRSIVQPKRAKLKVAS